MKMTKMLSLVALSVTAFGLAACGNNSSQSSATSSGKIEVITREDGSGTRGAFTEITGIKKKDKGKEIDNTSKSAVVQNSTEGVISAVSGNPQAVVSKNKFVEAKTEVTAYSSQKLSGKLSIVGSTSVAPLMEKLVEAYKKENPDVTIAITANGSSAGITATQEKTADIGMVSRELTPEEGKGLKHDAIALDGIAVVVNKDSKIDAISMKAIADVFTGKVNSWDKVN
ncbi:substrate-binding domain-containing protein [Streptococcus iniae]|uniref:Phosphate ABC transporter substrate-binding protein n=1 Tax=Streptococcus iniae TaxID=1346 RepID=A0ABM5QJ76_STRIN|nr:substrate-binding domain-containing protein [Streptococcus iniae]AGM99158.1 putative Phosphate-binding protein PstS 2 [Streptococcus iniae SF1]AHY16098.1 phosphate ABC transporter substrate-binding protein [Streptococcus iniae]AHY17961.1 phosphate ABC transporter substrate-binding protein [Streptococcus iniae]APD32134.1 phosphate ABC transporter substrate-binding protein [Streptococcus iniae]AYB01238.1 phosphate ABC transporter substrate-binding protein [Streptococcus iniae]